MNLNPITAFKKAKEKRKNAKVNAFTDNNAYADSVAELNKAKAKLPFTFRGLEEISSAWTSLGIRGATLIDKVVITSASKEFFAFDIRKFFDVYNKGAIININPQGFPNSRIICLDKNKKVISQVLVDSDTGMFAVTKSCKFLTIKGAK